MPDPTAPLGAAQRSPALRTLARVGHAANGILNVLIGGLAIGVAIGGASGSADQAGALQNLASTPGGIILVWVIAVGMLALGFWHLVTAVLARSEDRKELWKTRVKEGGKGVAYLAIAAIAIRVATSGSGGGSGGEESVTARLLASPGGVILVVLGGLVILGIGIAFVAKGIRRKFLDDLGLPGGRTGRAVTLLGIVGYVARGIAVGTIGILFVVAAATADPQKAGGLDDALSTLAGLPFGQILLVAIGVGFIAYGVYCGARARWGRL